MIPATNAAVCCYPLDESLGLIQRTVSLLFRVSKEHNRDSISHMGCRTTRPVASLTTETKTELICHDLVRTRFGHSVGTSDNHVARFEDGWTVRSDHPNLTEPLSEFGSEPVPSRVLNAARVGKARPEGPNRGMYAPPLAVNDRQRKRTTAPGAAANSLIVSISQGIGWARTSA